MNEPKENKAHSFISASPAIMQEEDDGLEEDCKNAIDKIIGQKFDMLKTEVS